MVTQAFVPRLLGQLYVEALVHGNLTEAEAKALADSVRRGLPAAKWLEPEARPQDRCTALQQGTTYLYRHATSPAVCEWCTFVAPVGRRNVILGSCTRKLQMVSKATTMAFDHHPWPSVEIV